MNKVDKLNNKLVVDLQNRAEKMHENEPAFKRQMNFDMFVILIFAAIIAISLNTFVFRMIRVKGPSMLPNFESNQRVFVDRITYKIRKPERFEVIICYYTHNGALILGDDPVIKRVIALPGETIEVKDGKVYINDIELDESMYWSGTIDSDMESYVVPSNCVFVIGDNRNNSQDSRDPSIQAVHDEDIIGIVRARVWPLDMIHFYHYNQFKAHDNVSAKK